MYVYVCTVTDFSAGALPIGVKLCMAVRPDLRQAFSYFGRIAPGMAEFWASTGATWRDMLLAEALVFCCSVQHINWSIFDRRYTHKTLFTKYWYHITT